MNIPQCPNCKGRMVSNGVTRWRCLVCGHSPTKVKIERKKPDYSKRPPCPDCGVHYALKHLSNEYRCGNCGRCFPKDWQAQRVYQQELNRIKADAIVEEPDISKEYEYEHYQISYDEE